MTSGFDEKMLTGGYFGFNDNRVVRAAVRVTVNRDESSRQHLSLGS